MDSADKSFVITGVIVLGAFLSLGIYCLYFLEEITSAFVLILYLANVSLTIPTIQRQIELHLETKLQKVKNQ